MSPLAPLFLIGSSSFLQVSRTQRSSNFGPIRQRTAELVAIECQNKIPKELSLERCCQNPCAFIFDWIFFILAGNEDNYKSLDEFEFRRGPSWTEELAAL